MGHEIVRPTQQMRWPGDWKYFYTQLTRRYPHGVDVPAYAYKVRHEMAPRPDQLASGASWTVRHNKRTGPVRRFAFETPEELREFRAAWPDALLGALQIEKLAREKADA